MRPELLCVVLLLICGCASPQVSTKIYDVRDLVLAKPQFAVQPAEFDLSRALSSSSSAAHEPVTRRELIDPMINLIQHGVGKAGDWQAYGGELSSVRELNGNLIIRTTRANHREIERLIDAMRPQPMGERWVFEHWR